MSQAHRTLKNTAHSTVAVWLEFFLGMVASIIIARTLAPATFGQYSFLMWCATVFVIAANGGLTTAIIKFMAEAGDDGDRAAVKTYIGALQRRFLLAMATLSVLVAIALPGLFSDSASWPLWSLVLCAALVKAAYIFEMSASKGREDFAAISRVMLVVGPLNILLCLLAAWRFPSLAGFVTVYTATSLAYLLAMMLFGQRGEPAETLALQQRQRIWRHIRITSVSIVLSFLVLRQSEVLFLKLLRPAEEIGFFNIAFTLGFALSALIPGVYAALLLPMMSRQSGGDAQGQAQRLTNALRYLQVLAIAMAAGTWVLGPLLVELLYGAAYTTAGDVLLWIIAGVAVAAIGQGAVSQLVSTDRQQHVLATNIVVTVLVLALDWWAISRFGLAGAGAAFLAGNVLHAGTMILLALRQSGARWPLAMTLRVVLASSAAALSTCGLLQLLAGWPPLAQLLVGAAVFVLVYAPATWLLGCWHPDEKAFIRSLARR